MGCGASKGRPDSVASARKSNKSSQQGSAEELPPIMSHKPSKEDTIEAVAVVVFQLMDKNEDGAVEVTEVLSIMSSLETEEKARHT